MKSIMFVIDFFDKYKMSIYILQAFQKKKIV